MNLSPSIKSIYLQTYLFKYCWVYVLLLFSSKISAQSNNAYNVDFYLGIKGVYNIGFKGEGNATISLSGGAGLYRDRLPLSLMFQSAINLYAKGIGTNLIDNYTVYNQDGNTQSVRRRLEIDFVQSIVGNIKAGIKRDDAFMYGMSIQSFNQMTATSMYMQNQFHLTFGSNFVFNNHNRNQQVGYLGLHFPAVSVNYFNDGVIGFLGDSYDRYWTGGGSIIYRNTNMNSPLFFQNFKAQIGFERFTDDVQDEYRLSNELLLPFVFDKNFYKLLYNNSLFYTRVSFRDFGVGLSMMGKYKGDFQDTIHERIVGNPRHKTHYPVFYQMNFIYHPQFNLK